MLVWQLVLWQAAPLDKGIQCAKIGQGSIETSNASSWSSENSNHFLLEALVNMSLIFLESVSTFAFFVCLALLVVFLSLPFFSWRRAKSRGNYKSQTWKLTTLEQPPYPKNSINKQNIILQNPKLKPHLKLHSTSKGTKQRNRKRWKTNKTLYKNR